MKITEELIEKLANIEHQRWAHWQKYIHSVCVKNDNGTLTIPEWAVIGWGKQINTNYEDLTKKEKDSDREQVYKYLKILENL